MDRALVVAGVVSLVAAATALLRARGRPATPRRVSPQELGLDAPSGVGVVGFSSEYCVPCRKWEAALFDSGVSFTKIDVGERPELARRYGVRVTPVILAVRLPEGKVLEAYSGEPRDDEIDRVLALAG